MSPNQQVRSTLSESFRGEGLNTVSKLTLNCSTGFYWQACWDQEKHWALLHWHGTGVCVCVCVCVCVSECVCQSTYCHNTFLHSYKHNDNPLYTNWHTEYMHLHQQMMLHACIHITDTYLFPFFNHQASLSQTTILHTQLHAQRAHTGFFFSHSCVQISNRACWERTNTLTRKD